MSSREQKNKKQRESRRLNSNKHTKKYERTLKGKLVRTYRNMLNRNIGISKPHLYKGKGLINKQDFYEWAISDEDYLNLFEEWVNSDYDRKLSPSIDRIDSSKGYVKGNLRWLTHSENSKLGAISLARKESTNL